MMNSRRCLAANLILLMSLSSLVHAASSKDSHQFNATINALANYNNSKPSWLSGDLGRYSFSPNSLHEDAGRSDHDERSNRSSLVEGNLEYRYRPNRKFQIRSFIQAHADAPSSSVTELGLVELEARYRKDLNFDHQLSFRIGQFFLPTSMENIERYWESPYTINFSSLNSWIGEEFRPIGADLQHRYQMDHGSTLTTGVTLFGGNDSMGALLAYRGWSYGRLRTAYNDVVALPKLETLSDTGLFSEQRQDGTKPFGRDLDHRPGYALRLAYTSDRLALSAAWIDNLGDTELHQGEYAWRTKFGILGVSWFATPELEFIAEASKGSTTMGSQPGIDIDFYSAYGMASYRHDDYRLSYRFDLFGSDDKDQMDDENHDFGRSHTLALMWNPNAKPYSAGIEATYLHSKRARTLEDLSLHQDRDAVSLSALLQYTF